MPIRRSQHPLAAVSTIQPDSPRVMLSAVADAVLTVATERDEEGDEHSATSSTSSTTYEEEDIHDATMNEPGPAVPDAVELSSDEDAGLDQDDEHDDLRYPSQAETVEEDDSEMSSSEDEDDDSEMAMSDDIYATEEERAATRREMALLDMSVPQLRGRFKLVDKLGEGTFSSVYKAVDSGHFRYDNTLWATPYALIPTTPDGSLAPELAPETPAVAQLRAQQDNGKVYVALKRIYVTSSPERILNELEILSDLRGCTNVAYLIDAMRHEDQVIAIMPFNRHQDFRDYYRSATFPMLRSYFACLFRALACSHNQHIIHRDVKPANFLYDLMSGTGVLCDFGLAEKTGAGLGWDAWRGECCHSFPGPSWGGLAGRARAAVKWPSCGLDSQAPPPFSSKGLGPMPGLSAGLHGAKLARPLPLADQIVAMKNEWKEVKQAIREAERAAELDDRCPGAPDWQWEVHDRMQPSFPLRQVLDNMMARDAQKASWYKAWRPPLSRRQVVERMGGRAGYLAEDRRPSVRANRAGTRGFRAPEVLLKCPDQTVALDVWSVGIVLLCFLTKRFPFFNSSDDVEALAELMAIFGRKKMTACAAMHNRTLLTNIPSYDPPIHPNLHSLVTELNPALLETSLFPRAELDAVVDLLERCLELDLTRRLTAEELLEHDFFDMGGTARYDLGGGRLGPRGVLHSAVRDWPGSIMAAGAMTV